ncbi:MAG: site-2 protease family protein [Pseudomonadota bacterium]
MSLKLRPDLHVSSFHEGGNENTVILKDPVTDRFFRLSQYEFRFLKALDGTCTVPETIERLNGAGFHYKENDVKTILERASKMGLLLGSVFETADLQSKLRDQYKQAKKAQRFTTVFFAFIPLVNPDRFLEKTLPIFKLLYNRVNAVLLAFATVGAVYLLIDGLPRLTHQYTFFFNLENLLYLWIAIAFTKLIHEFAHAYVAKICGIRVPQMGVAFLIFFPCLFCNTTDAWKLGDRRQRIAIALAGIFAELVLAVLATYVWYFTKPGIVNSLAFYQVAVASISTILFNGNPLIRFDGYFALSDALRIPNLMLKSRNYVKYLVWNKAMGIARFASPARTRRERTIFGLQGVGQFVYRIFLYVGIIAGVYFRFDKTLGILLAILAFVLFVVRPIVKGVRDMFSLRNEMHPRLAGVGVLLLCAVAVAAFLVMPLSANSLYSCYTASACVQKITLPLYTSIRESYIRKGSPVRKGDVLMVLDTNALELAVMKRENDRQIAEQEIELLRLDEKNRARVQGAEHKLHGIEQEIAFLKRDLAVAKSGVTAPFDGVVTYLDHHVQEGFMPGEGAVVGELQCPERLVVYGLIPEEDVGKIGVGEDVEVWLPVRTGSLLRGKIDHVRPYSEMDMKGLPFSSRVGGDVAVEAAREGAKDEPLNPMYVCSVDIGKDCRQVPLGITGELAVHSRPRSLFAGWVDSTIRTLNRESLF